MKIQISISAPVPGTRASKTSNKPSGDTAEQAVERFVSELSLVKFQILKNKFLSSFKYSEAKAATNKKVEKQIRDAIKKFKLKPVQSSRQESPNQGGVSGRLRYRGSDIEVVWNRSVSFQTGTTYHTVTVEPST